MLDARWMGRCKEDSNSKAVRLPAARVGAIVSHPHSCATGAVTTGAAGRSGTVGARRQPGPEQGWCGAAGAGISGVPCCVTGVV